MGPLTISEWLRSLVASTAWRVEAKAFLSRLGKPTPGEKENG